MTRLEAAHTGQLDAKTLAQTRALLDDVFGQEMTDLDWDHALGGMHALVWDGDRLLGHASVVQRQLLHGDRALRAGYVEGVAVAPDRRREGHATTAMQALERIIRGAYELGALGATPEAQAFYEVRGWQRWRGRLSALTPSGITPTPEEEGAVYVLPVNFHLDLDGELTCDWREGDVW